jgi:hypothetical protein
VNPLTTALTRAVAVAKDRASLIAAFDRELEALEFAPGNPAIVLPVPRLAALAWSRGEICDLDLCLLAGKPEAIWAFLLPNLSQMRSAVSQARAIYDAGATAYACYSNNPLVSRHFMRYGCAVRHTAPNGGIYLYGDENMVRRYFRVPFQV